MPPQEKPPWEQDWSNASPAKPPWEMDWSGKSGVPQIQSGPARELPKSAEAGQKLLSAGLSALAPVASMAAAPFTGGMSVLGEAATMFGVGAGAKAAELGVRKLGGIDPPASFGAAAKETAEEGAMQAGTSLAFRGAGKILEKTLGRYLNPERLYQSGLKPSGTNEEMAARHVKTGLREKIELTGAAPAIARQRWEALNSEVESIVNGSPADISEKEWVSNIQGKLDTLRSKWGKVAGAGQKYVDQIDNFERQFILENGNPRPITKMVMKPSSSGIVGPNGKPLMVPTPETIQPEDMDLPTLRKQAQPLKSGNAQEIKKATYEAIRTQKQTAWDPGVHPGLQVRMQTATARALKQELEQIYPQLRAKNMREGDLIGLERELQRFVKREMNKQSTPYFIFPIVGGMAGAAFGGTEGAGVGGGVGALAGHLIRNAMEDPAVKSRIAIMLKNAGTVAKTAAKVAKQVPQAAARGVEGYAEHQIRHPVRGLAGPGLDKQE